MLKFLSLIVINLFKSNDPNSDKCYILIISYHVHFDKFDTLYYSYFKFCSLTTVKYSMRVLNFSTVTSRLSVSRLIVFHG